MKNLTIKTVLMSTVSLAVLAGCNTTPNPVVNPTPTPQQSVIPSSNPSTTPSINPSTNPSTNPSGNPSSNPSVTPSSTPSTNPSSSIAPSQPPKDTATVEDTTLNGKVYDDSNAPLDGVSVRVRSLNASIPYDVVSVTAGGAYALNKAPAGVQLEITASKPGYATRRRVEVLKSNKNGDPNANRYDFGTDGSASTQFGVQYNSLSDKPEVMMATPGRNASNIDPATAIVLKFSEPMDTDTVEENFAVYAASTETLSVDATDPTFNKAFDNAQDTSPAVNSKVWDESAFNISWNAEHTEVTFSFKDEQRLPSDTESENIPDYAISLTADDGQIKDKSGVTRDADDDGYFKLTDGNFEGNYKFAITGDDEKPELASINALTGENGNTVGDEIEVEFSEPMIFYTEGGQIRGNMAGGAEDEDPTNPENYFISVNGGAEQNLDTLNGNVSFDTNDRTHKTVLLRSFGNLYAPGAKVKIRISNSMVDPAGNSLDSANDEDDDTAS